MLDRSESTGKPSSRAAGVWLMKRQGRRRWQQNGEMASAAAQPHRAPPACLASLPLAWAHLCAEQTSGSTPILPGEAAMLPARDLWGCSSVHALCRGAFPIFYIAFYFLVFREIASASVPAILATDRPCACGTTQSSQSMPACALARNAGDSKRPATGTGAASAAYMTKAALSRSSLQPQDRMSIV